MTTPVCYALFRLVWSLNWDLKKAVKFYRGSNLSMFWRIKCVKRVFQEGFYVINRIFVQTCRLPYHVGLFFLICLFGSSKDFPRQKHIRPLTTWVEPWFMPNWLQIIFNIPKEFLEAAVHRLRAAYSRVKKSISGWTIGCTPTDLELISRLIYVIMKYFCVASLFIFELT